MKFSLIISTIGRMAEVQRLLGSIAAQTCQDFEVIVSDQNPDERLAPILQSDVWKGRLTHLRNTGGVSLGRNEGLKIARGEIIGFPDDDCVYSKELLRQVARFFEEKPSYGFLSGRSCDDEGHDSVSRHAPQASPIRREVIHLQCMEFAMFIRRAELGQMKFDENMGVGSPSPWQADEGPDLLLRLMKNGVAGYYDPAISVWHRPPIHILDAKEIDRSYRYACGNGYFLRKHGYTSSYFARVMLRTTGGLVLALGLFHFAKARLYLARLRGRMRGWMSYRKDEAQEGLLSETGLKAARGDVLAPAMLPPEGLSRAR